MHIKKSDITFTILTIANLAYFFFSSMSGYKPITIYIKISLGIILTLAIFADIYFLKVYFNREDLLTSAAITNIFNLRKSFKSVLSVFQSSYYRVRGSMLFFIFLLLISASLLYSPDQTYGVFKLVNLILNIIFITLANIYYIKRLNTKNEKTLFYVISSAAVISLVSALIISPFNYDSSQVLSLTRWSHVQYSRFLALAYFIVLYIYLKGGGTSFSTNMSSHTTCHSRERGNPFNKISLIPNYITIPILSVLLFGIYYAGLRSSLIGITLATAFIFLHSLFTHKPKATKIAALTLTLLPIILIILQPLGEEKTNKRYDNMLQVEEMKFNNDDPIQTRLHVYKESIEIIKRTFPIGTGFGGYKPQTESSNWNNYPHNIFLETLIELGLPGIILLLIILFLIFKTAFKISPIVTAILIYGLTLAFFSKDIPNQSFIFLCLALTSKTLKTNY